MNLNKSILTFSLVLFFLSACGLKSNTPESPTENLDTQVQTESITSTTVVDVETQVTAEPPPLVFAEPGPYFVGKRGYTIIDQEHDDREIGLLIWYPALEQSDTNGQKIIRDATPDMSKAPYPLILVEEQSGSVIFKDHLASYGFVMVSISIPGMYGEGVDANYVDAPRDFIFTIDQIAKGSLPGLEGVIDFKHTGITGFSYGGDISLALGGARINPAYYLNFCENPTNIAPKYGGADWYHEMNCILASKWDSFLSEIGEGMVNIEDGLFVPLTDDRIKAILPMAMSAAWLYGEKGIAAVNKPILLLAATEDQYSPYQIETKFIFDNIGSPDKAIISVVGEDHYMPFTFGPREYMQHFAVAFFGYHLQGREEYKQYFSEEFVKQFYDLAWGIYQGD